MGSSPRHGDGQADLPASPPGGGRGSARGRRCRHRECLPHVCAMGAPEGRFSMGSPPGMCPPMPICWASPAPQNANPLGITPGPLAEGLEPLGWIQPHCGGCMLSPAPSMSLCHGSPSTAKPGVPPGHAPITSRGQGVRDEPCRCQPFACPGVQAAQHHCSQRAGTVPACGHPGSSTRRRFHRL